MENIKNIIAVFGGSFNPPLNSHFSLGQQIVNEYENVDKVLFVPVSTSYAKPGLISNEHRYNMLKLVCDKNPDFEVSDIELVQDRQLYTLETLELLQEKYPGKTICFTIGTDNLRELSTWKLIDKLVDKFKILVLERDEDDMYSIIEQNEFLKKNKDCFIKLKENIRSNISSTFARDKLKRGKSIRYLTPDEVYNYINENNLY